MSYSIDFRRKVLELRRQKGLSIRQTAEYFQVGITTITRWLRCIEPKGFTPRHRKIDKAALLKDVELYPDAYQHERATRFNVSTKAIWQALRGLGITYKKNTLSSRSQRKQAIALPKKES